VDNTQLKLFLFRLGEEWLGWPLAQVREVSSFQPLHAIPNQNNPLLKGLVNINGELMLCVSLGLLLGLQRSSGVAESRLAPRMLVLGTQDESWVVPLSEARGRVGFAASALQAPPHTAGLPQARYSLGVLPWEGKQVSYLDSRAVLQALRERSHVSNTGL
jgi:chemotaxis-related protein WspD